MDEFNVIIIGAGLAGPLLASGLLAAGIKVDVYERLAADAKRDGYQIRVAQPSLRAFRQELTEDQCARITEKLGAFHASEKETTPIWYDHQMKELMKMSRISTEFHGSAPMDRVVLRKIIMEQPLSKGIVHFSKAFTRYEVFFENEKERVRVFFDDGSSAECDILIAADGNHSKVNSQIGLNNIQALPAVNFVSKVNISMDQLKKLPEAVLKSPILCFSHKMTYFCVAYLPPGYSKQSDDGDKPTRISNSDDPSATFSFALLMYKDQCPDDIRERSNAEQWQFLQDSVSTWDKTYPDVIEVLKGADLHIYEPRGSTKPDLNWRAKVRSQTDPTLGHPRVWVLGDAMHPMLPNRGMGGNMAMLDTTVILPLLKRLRKSAEKTGTNTRDEISQACAEYEREMIPRAFYWVKESGGTQAVPLDTNTFMGRFAAFSMNLTFDIRDMWYAVCSMVGLGK